MSIPARFNARCPSRPRRWTLRAVLALTALYPLAATPANAEAAASETIAAIPVALPIDNAAGDSDIRARLEGVATPLIAGQKLHTQLLWEFYASHNFQPVWPTHQEQAAALLAAVMRAGEHGLNPDLFHAASLRNPGSLTPTDRELLLSDAFLGYADALARGILPVEKRMDDEDLRPEAVSIPATLDAAIGSDNPAAVIEALAPQSAEYIALRRALQSYGQAVRTGATPASTEGRYRRVSERTDATRMRDIEANLERQRWLPRHLPADRIWVNLPAEQLILYRNNQPVFTTRVIIGQPDWQTPELETEVTSVLYNPPWNVPPSIAREEILPKLSRDPGYLARHHMVWRANGMLQQVPGRGGSALGQLKFEMPNRFDVYLHDTPEKFLFSRDNRRVSHGCVRVQNPRELAALALQTPVETINQGIARGATAHQMLPQPIPVFFVYQTAFLGPNGAIEFRPDVYNRDPEIWQHLLPMRQAPVAQGQTARQPRG